MRFLSNAHTHTTYCDGKRGTDAEQLAGAQRLGFVSLVFPGTPCRGFDWNYCMSPENHGPTDRICAPCKAGIRRRRAKPEEYTWARDQYAQ
jgi:hypothetical protein